MALVKRAAAKYQPISIQFNTEEELNTFMWILKHSIHCKHGKVGRPIGYALAETLYKQIDKLRGEY